MEQTPLLSLPLLAHKQALQTTFHDEGMKALDALVMLSVIDRDLPSPPGSPEEGDRYIVSAPGSGDPAWLDDHVVVYIEGHWVAHQPRLGWTCYVQDEAALIVWDGEAWQPALDVLGGGMAQNLSRLGVATDADATNPVSFRVNNVLCTALPVADGGDGDLRYKLSKDDEANTVSLLFQDGFFGRAEIGLTGDDDFHVKVSPDGSTWLDAIVIDRSTGEVSLPLTSLSSASDDLDLILAELALGLADALNVAQFLGSSGNRFADSFDALTYVDTGGATNLDTGTAGLLKPSSGSPSAILAGAGTAIGGMTGAGGLAAAFDTNTSQNADTTCCQSASVASGYVNNNAVGKDWGSGNSEYIERLEIWGPADAGFMGAGAVGFKLQGSTDNFSSSVVDLYASTTGTGSGQHIDVTSGITSTTAYRYHRVVFNGNGTNNARVSEVKFYRRGATNNLTVASAALTAVAAPSTAKLVLMVKEVDAITLNTDIKGYASRNNGSNYSEFTLTKLYTGPGSIAVYESDDLDVSGQPSGTQMKWKVQSFGNDRFELHAASLYWRT